MGLTAELVSTRSKIENGVFREFSEIYFLKEYKLKDLEIIWNFRTKVEIAENRKFKS